MKRTWAGPKPVNHAQNLIERMGESSFNGITPQVIGTRLTADIFITSAIYRKWRRARITSRTI